MGNVRADKNNGHVGVILKNSKNIVQQRSFMTDIISVSVCSISHQQDLSCLTLVVAWIVLGSLLAYPPVLSTVYDNWSSSPTRFFMVTTYQNVSNEYHPRQRFVFQYIMNPLSQGGSAGS